MGRHVTTTPGVSGKGVMTRTSTGSPSSESVSCLHFEACYYRPLEWCVAQRLARFEGGAQGEHKMARGLLPVPTASAHWLAHPQFANAVAEFLDREGAGIAEYLDELSERRPFKAAP